MAATYIEGRISNFGSKVEYNTEKIKCMCVSINPFILCETYFTSRIRVAILELNVWGNNK